MTTAEERLQEIRDFYHARRDRMGLTMTLKKEKAPEKNIPNFIARVIYEATRGTIPAVGARDLAREAVNDFQKRYVELSVRQPVEELFDFRTTMPGSIETMHGVSNVDDFIAFTTIQLEPHRGERLLAVLNISPRFRAFQAGILGPRPEVGFGGGGGGGIPGAHFDTAPPGYQQAPPEYRAPPKPQSKYTRETVRGYHPPPTVTPDVIALPPPRGVYATPLTREYVEERIHTGPEGVPVTEIVHGIESEPAPTFERPAGPVKQVSLFGEKVVSPAYTPPSLAAQLEDKYRPLHLSDVLANEEAVRSLKAAAEAGNFSKAYLIVGRPGTGKTSAVAAAIRDYLDKVAPGELYNPNYTPEDKQMGISPTILLRYTPLELARLGAGTLIDNVSRFVRSGGMLGGAVRRFVVLDDITRLSPEAQEVLLPLTERFPRVAFFFLANSENFTPQLHSRFREYKWQTPTPELVQFRLVHIIQQEHMPFPEPTATALGIAEQLRVRNMGGDFRQAIILLADEARVAGWRPT